MKFTFLPVSLLFFFTATLPAQTIRYVNHAASGNADGSSWANAFTRFQQALDVAQDGDEIWVAQGTYKPSTNDDRYAFYNLPSGVQVYGGFAGTETQIEQRDWAANLTILSGDIGNLGDSTDNSFNILYSYSPNEKTRLDGLIFEEGNATNFDNNIEYHRPTRSGGGIYLDGEGFGYAQLSVTNCTFRRNRALYQGGGIYANGREGGMAIVRLENCLFERNVSQTYGGGFALENYFEQPFSLDLKECEFRENYASTGGDAVWLKAHQAVTFTDCKFLRNRTIWGEAISFGEVDINYPVSFKKCIFKENGDYTIWYIGYTSTNDAEFDFEDCIFQGNGLSLIYLYFFNAAKIRAVFENCIFDSNKRLGNSEERVISIISDLNKGEVFITNCLFVENKGNEIIVWPSTSSVKINNNIIIDKEGDNNKTVLGGSAIYTVSNTLFRLPNCTSLGGFNTTILCDSTNLFGLDPLFVNPSISDFHLQPCSPAINAGTNAILDSLGITTDLDGNSRIRNEVVDMGPYETNVSLHPSISTQPACAGASDGAVEFSPDICPPFSFVWSNGMTTGTNTNGLAAGTYVFTATGSNNIPVSDTIAINEPLLLEITIQPKNARCYGEPSGRVETFVSGGTAPYLYNWDPVIPSVPSHYNLLAGTYFLTVTDANGCTGTMQTTIGSPDPIQVFYTTQNVSCIACSDGSIIFDSIVGGTNPPLPASLVDIPAGVYCFTFTDAVGCQAVVCTTVHVVSNTNDESIEDWLKLSPNPTVCGETALLEWLDNESATLRILDLHGRILEEKWIAQNTSTRLNADWPPGIYQVEIQTISGKRAVRRWAIF